jgi:predicted nucleotidyltransferase
MIYTGKPSQDYLKMQDKDLQGIANKISALCSQESAIDAAYLFGSAATGKTSPGSDLDVAVLLNNASLDEFRLLAFLSSLERSCSCRADVVILNRAGEVLKYEVRRSGRLIFQRDASRRKKFEISGRKTYEDFLYLHRRHTGAVLYGETHG